MPKAGEKVSENQEYELIFRRSVKTRNGKVLIAAHYGLDAFPIRVRRFASTQMELFEQLPRVLGVKP